MTEAEWLAAADPASMLAYLRGKASDRKLRLLASGVLRRVLPLLVNADWAGTLPLGFVLDVADRYADGAATEAERVRSHDNSSVEFACALAPDAWEAARGSCRAACGAAHGDAAHRAAKGVTDWHQMTIAVKGAGRPAYLAEARSQPGVVRCVFGNPFRPVAVDPSWRTSAVVALAEGVYADRAFDRLPVLAAALEDTGCENEDILAHCRSGGPHVRGCWAVDLLLGKS